jgi:hypothetical protein
MGIRPRCLQVNCLLVVCLGGIELVDLGLEQRQVQIGVAAVRSEGNCLLGFCYGGAEFPLFA